MIKGIQNLSREDIELKVIEVIEYFRKEILDHPCATPILEFVQQLQKEDKIIIDLTKDLGNTNKGIKIVGLFNLKPRGIYIDMSLINDNRFNFTLSHEIGHLVLHRKLTFKQEEYEGIQDTEYDMISGKHILKTDRDWIEWQANYFGSAFLMPKQTFIEAVRQIQDRMGIIRNQGMIYLDNTSSSIRDFEHIKGELKKIYIVNVTNIEIRINDLGILNDQRLKNVNHISRLFREE